MLFSECCALSFQFPDGVKTIATVAMLAFEGNEHKMLLKKDVPQSHDILSNRNVSVYQYHTMLAMFLSVRCK